MTTGAVLCPAYMVTVLYFDVCLAHIIFLNYQSYIRLVYE
jgi:hypothetical protein